MMDRAMEIMILNDEIRKVEKTLELTTLERPHLRTVDGLNDSYVAEIKLKSELDELFDSLQALFDQEGNL